MTIRFTTARNLRELNRMTEYPVEFAGYYAETTLYEGKKRAYRFTEDNPRIDDFGIIFNSDIEQFVMKGERHDNP